MLRPVAFLLVTLLTSVTLALALAAEMMSSARAETEPCRTIEIDYALDGQLRLTDTPMGKGDGVYPVGPGTAVVRFEVQNGAPAGPAELVAYEMSERFRIDSRAVFWETHVTTDARTTVREDPCGVVARGALSGSRLDWSSDVRGARTDGRLICEGSLCGKFGAPPAGESPLHVAPHPVRFAAWAFTPDLARFTMASSWSAHSESPRQTSYVALVGREVSRRCAAPPRCGH
jgi:hypothetical protein